MERLDIQRLLRVEEKADEVLEEARRRAEEIIRQAREEAEKILEEAKRKAAEWLSTTYTGDGEATREILKRYEEEALQLSRRAEENLEKAVDFVVKVVTG